MSNQFVGEIRPFACNFAPTGWALCDGQLLPISQNTALFSLLGTQYGGDGKSNFALPNLQGNVAVSQGILNGGQPYTLGETGGFSKIVLYGSQSPAHSHQVDALTSSGTSSHPAGNMFAEAEYKLNPEPLYDSAAKGTLAVAAVGPSGSSQPHTNLQPSLVINYCIALQGIFPARN